MFTLRNFLFDKWAEMLFFIFGVELILTVFIALINSKIILILLGGLFILTTILIFVIKDFLFIKRVTRDGLIIKLDSPRKAIIFTVGFRSAFDDSILYRVHEKLKPELVGFLETQETNEKGIVHSIVQKLQLENDKFKTMMVDPTNIDEIKMTTKLIVDWFKQKNINEDEILLDLTAGTALMSVASFIAADEQHIDTLYLYSEYEKNLPIKGTQKPILIRSFEKERV